MMQKSMMQKSMMQKSMMQKSMMQKSMMQEVTMENLIPGKEYWMECFTYNEEGQFVPHRYRYKMIAKFDKCIYSQYGSTSAGFTNFREIKFKDNKTDGYAVNLNNYYWRFYEVLKNKVQKDMENRAYKTILEEKIRDEYFEYTAF